MALVELGAGMTNVSVYAGGVLLGMYSIPMGASDITDDIASAFGIRRSQAERVKCFYGSAMQNPRDFREMIEIVPNVAEGERSDGGKITRAALSRLFAERLDEDLPRQRGVDPARFRKPAGAAGGADRRWRGNEGRCGLWCAGSAGPNGAHRAAAWPSSGARSACRSCLRDFGGSGADGHMKPLEIGGPGSAGPRKGAGDGKGGWWQRLTHALKKNY